MNRHDSNFSVLNEIGVDTVIYITCVGVTGPLKKPNFAVIKDGLINIGRVWKVLVEESDFLGWRDKEKP